MLALDVGRRRVGVAISDPTGTLARPHSTIHVTDHNAIVQVSRAIAELVAEDDGVGEIVVGLPRRLNGEANAQTAAVSAFVTALRSVQPIPIVTEDERLSSHEADSRLGATERDWRKRKAQLDAAAAAVILQDYLDRRSR